ncbi:MAG: amidohydrolase [Clostridiales Family XIII bacterium]|jgi:5-methylthioadenosine/S-adenosylhomocysteine deaminase|nr:amidohydrolase [Clostridiales Family XIII bacterium]
MLFENIAVLDEGGRAAAGKYVGVTGERIAYIGDTAPAEDFGETYAGAGRLLMPAFYNAHAHSPMTLLRGYGENLKLQDWLTTRIFPFEDKLTGEAVYAGTLLAVAESLRFGIVSTTDMYYFCEDMLRAFLESGAKVNISRGLTCFTDAELADLPGFQEAKRLFETYDGAADGRVVAEMSLHAEYTSNPKIAAQLAEYANKTGAGMHVHISETKTEHAECMARRGGKTPVAYLASLGFFETRTTAAHCVHVTEEDMDILARKGVTVASCPISNMKLSSGVCNVPRLLEKGVNVAIGTDGAASNNSLNFIEEMKFFALSNKLMREDPTLVSPADTIAAATVSGAKSQGRPDCGAIRVGAKADLIVLDLSVPNMHPVHALANNIVYAAAGGDVRLTMADGKVLYRDGSYKTIDIEKALFEADAATRRIRGELGEQNPA